MKISSITEHEIAGIHVWTGSDQPLTHDQTILCVALERLGCNAMPEEIANYCQTDVATLLELQRGIFGILIDGSTGRFWIK